MFTNVRSCQTFFYTVRYRNLTKKLLSWEFLNTENQCQQRLPKWNNENINTMIIIMDFVVSRLLLTLFGLALKSRMKKICDIV